MKRMLNLKTGISNALKFCLLFAIILISIRCIATGKCKAASIEVKVVAKAKPAKTLQRLTHEPKTNVKLLAHNKTLLLRAPARVRSIPAEPANASRPTRI